MTTIKGELYLAVPAAVDAKVVVGAEMDRRLSLGFMFRSKMIQYDSVSQTAVNTWSITAKTAIDAGVQDGNLRWADQAVDFAWTTGDNSPLYLDANSMLVLQQAGSIYLGAVRAAGTALKARIRANERIYNVKDDSLWPSIQSLTNNL